MLAPRLQGSRRAVLGALGAALVMCAPAIAGAQEGVALPRFDPAPAGDRMFGVPSPYTAGHLTPHVMLLADYAHDPLVLRSEADDEVVGAVVGGQLVLHLNAAFALFRRVTVDADVPLAAVQTGDSPSAGGQGLASPTSAEFGDLRLGARVRLFGGYHDPFQFALGAYFWLPTGAQGSFVSDGSARFMPQAIAGGRTDLVVWSVAVGPEIRRTQEIAGVTQGTMLKWGAGVGFLATEEGRLQIGPEVNAAMVLSDVDARTLNAELLLGAKYRVLQDVEAGLGVGPGLSGGVGTPDIRVVGLVAYTPAQPRVHDRDDDGIPDAEDACPRVPGEESADRAKHGCPPPEDQDRDGIPDADDACPTIAGPASADPKKNGCPKADQDGDGIPDAEDACPTAAGIPSDDPKKNGCPEDRDRDGVPDVSDACPEIEGSPSADPAKNGCPQDRDQDGIPDAKDACPQERGYPAPEPENNGCPRAVRVTEKEVLLLQQVQFDFDRATIKKESDALLDEVAQVLKEHPEILSVEVQGHTDEVGSAQHNKKLSQRRADAVRQALIQRGIDSERLGAKGYGREVPLSDNTTDEGRQKNRRVEFRIIQKKPRAEP